MSLPVTAPSVPFSTLCLLGPGLIGGSLALAANEYQGCSRLVVWDRDESMFPALAERLKSVPLQLTTSLKEAVSSADAVILCTPIPAMAELAEKFVPHLPSPDVVISDVGSVKGSVLSALTPIFHPPGRPPRAILIGGHPMAGSEKGGFLAGRANLFQQARVVLVPPDSHPAPAQALARLTTFWQILGADVLHLSARVHDQLVATISHTPHLLAAVLSNSLAGPNQHLLSQLAAGGFRDMTRIAQSDPHLWTEILFANRSAVLASLEQFRSITAEAIQALNTNDRPTLDKFLAQAQTLRLQLPPKPLP